MVERYLLGWVALEKVPVPISKNAQMRLFLFAWNDILADVVVANTKQSNGSSPGSNNLAGQLAASILPVCTKSNNTANNGKTHSIAQHNWVVGILLYLLLGGFLLCSSLVLDVLGLLFNFLFPLNALGLRVGLDRLGLIVGGDRGDMGAVYIDERVDAVIRRVLDLRRGGGTTAV